MTIESLDKLEARLKSIWDQGGGGQAYFDLCSGLLSSASDLFGLAREALRLRQLVEDAPHAGDCKSQITTQRNVCLFRRKDSSICNCWKSLASRDMAADKEKS